MTTAARGRQAFNDQAEAAAKNRGSGFARILSLKTGEKIHARFRGLPAEPPREPLSWVEERASIDELKAVCKRLGVWGGVKEDNDPLVSLRERIKERWTQVEPFVYSEHFVANNKGSGLRQYLTCACKFPDTQIPDCVPCLLKQDGDRRISIKSTSVFSVVPKRKYHYTKAQGNTDKDFVYCPKWGYNSTPRCPKCDMGGKDNEPKQEGLHRLSLAPTHVNGLFACWDRIALRCGGCGGWGNVQVTGYECANPECGEPFTEHQATVVGPNGFRTPKTVTCSECKHTSMPREVVACDNEKGCAEPRRAMPWDFDVLIEKHGEKKQTTYGFTEVIPSKAMPEEILQQRVPSYEQLLAPESTDTQCRWLGLATNPFTNKPVAAAPRSAESGGSTETEGYGGDAVDVNY